MKEVLLEELKLQRIVEPVLRIDLDQANLLFTQGFKSQKTYDYFELLLWAWEQTNPITELTDWAKWQNIELSFTQELVQEWQQWGFTYEVGKEWIDIGLSPQDAKYCAWLKQKNFTPEYVLNEANSDALCAQFKAQASSLKPFSEKQLSWNQFLTNNSPLNKVWESYLTYQMQRMEEQLEKNRQELAEKGLIGQEIQNKKINLRELIPSLADYIDNRIQTSEKRVITTSSTTEEIPSSSQSQPEPSTSRYDDLLANLSKEEQERAKKQKSRQEARKKLDDMEFNRREQNLETKQQKFQQEEERRAKERELQEQELQARQQAFEARQKELKDQEEKRLTSQAEQIETKKKMAEEALKLN